MLDSQILILQNQIILIKEIQRMSDKMDQLAQEVAAEGTVVQSAVTLLDGISQQLKDAQASNDPAAIQAVIDAVDTQKQQLADAITRNTPAAAPVAGSSTAPADTTGNVSPSA